MFRLFVLWVFLKFLILTLEHKGRRNGKPAVKCAVREKTKRSPVFKDWKYRDHQRYNFTLHIWSGRCFVCGIQRKDNSFSLQVYRTALETHPLHPTVIWITNLNKFANDYTQSRQHKLKLSVLVATCKQFSSLPLKVRLNSQIGMLSLAHLNTAHWHGKGGVHHLGHGCDSGDCMPLKG